MMAPDRRVQGQGHPWFHGWPCLIERNIPWKFCVYIFIRSVSRMGGPPWRYLEDVEGSWPETWRTGSSSRSWIISWKFHVIIFIFGRDIRVSQDVTKRWRTKRQTDRQTLLNSNVEEYLVPYTPQNESWWILSSFSRIDNLMYIEGLGRFPPIKDVW